MWVLRERECRPSVWSGCWATWRCRPDLVAMQAGLGACLMAEAAGAIVEYAFGSLDLDRVEAWWDHESPVPFPLPAGSASPSRAD